MHPKWLHHFVDIKNWNYNFDTGILHGNQRYHAGFFESFTLEEIECESHGLTFQIIHNSDISQLILNAEEGEIFQVASQFNALEMIDPTSTSNDGIEIYAWDNTQGPKAALSCVAGTFVRNYSICFDALKDLKLHSKNGYLLWGDKPESILKTLQVGKMKIKVPCMLHTQVVGIVPDNPIKMHKQNKCVHQIFTSTAPINIYGNGGDIKTQREISRILLHVGYRVCLGIVCLLRKHKERAKLHLTLLGVEHFKTI